jgi:hypothetical protein
MAAHHILIDGLGGREPLRHIVTRFDADVLFGRDDCMAWLPVARTRARIRRGGRRTPSTYPLFLRAEARPACPRGLP